MNIYDDGRRAAPKVPGINAQPLQPSIAPDQWRTNDSQSVPISGGGCNVKRFGPRPSHGKLEGAVCEAGEYRRLALDEASGIARGDSEAALIRNARQTARQDAAARCLIRFGCDSLASGTDERKATVANLIREALELDKP